MKRLSVFLLILGMVVSSYASASEGIKWYSLKEGLEKAKTEKSDKAEAAAKPAAPAPAKDTTSTKK